jgi:hypothetical protein
MPQPGVVGFILFCPRQRGQRLGGAFQRIVIERLAVGETPAARAQRVDQLADDDLRPIAALLVRAWIQAGNLPQLVPEIETAGYRLVTATSPAWME